MLAQHYLEELEYDQAIAAYKAAIEIDPSRPEAYLGLAEVYAALEKYGAAVAILERGAGQSKSDVITGKLEEMKVMMQQMQAAEVIEDEVVVATRESTDSQKEDESIVEDQIEINETQENSDDNAIQENEQSQQDVETAVVDEEPAEVVEPDPQVTENVVQEEITPDQETVVTENQFVELNDSTLPQLFQALANKGWQIDADGEGAYIILYQEDGEPNVVEYEGFWFEGSGTSGGLVEAYLLWWPEYQRLDLMINYDLDDYREYEEQFSNQTIDYVLDTINWDIDNYMELYEWAY